METERLFLRLRTRQQLEEVLALPLLGQMKFFGFSSEAELAAEMEKFKKCFEHNSMAYYKWDLLDKDTQKVVGSCSLHNLRLEHLRAEIGYFLFEDSRGKGYMGEALKKVLQFGIESLKLNRIEAFISPYNEASKNTVKRLGFTEEGTLREHFKVGDTIFDSVAFSLLRSEYQPSE